MAVIARQQASEAPRSSIPQKPPYLRQPFSGDRSERERIRFSPPEGPSSRIDSTHPRRTTTHLARTTSGHASPARRKDRPRLGRRQVAERVARGGSSCGSPRLREIAPSPLHPGTPNIPPPPSLLGSEVPRQVPFCLGAASSAVKSSVHFRGSTTWIGPGLATTCFGVDVPFGPNPR